MENHAIVLNDAKKQQKYYAVHCKCGHVGRNNYVEIVFAIKAANARDAASIARKLSRVKHHKKSAILDCYQISYEKYCELIEINRKDPYFKCNNIQDQRSIEGFESRIVKEPEVQDFKKNKKERIELLQYKAKKQKQYIEELMNYNYMRGRGGISYENVY